MRIQEREALLASAFPSASSSRRYRWSCSKNSMCLIGTLAVLGIISISVMIIKFPDGVWHHHAQKPQQEIENTYLISNITHHHKDDYISLPRKAAPAASSERRRRRKAEPKQPSLRNKVTSGLPAILPTRPQIEEGTESIISNNTTTSIPEKLQTIEEAEPTIAATTPQIPPPILQISTNPPKHSLFVHDPLCGGCKMITVDNSYTTTCGSLISQLVQEWAGLSYERSAKHVVGKHPECHVCLQCHDLDHTLLR